MTKVALPDVLDKASLPALAETMARMIGPGKALVVDGSQAGRVGLSAVQLLASAARTAREAGGTFSIDAASPELEAALRFAGLDARSAMAGMTGAAA